MADLFREYDRIPNYCFDLVRQKMRLYVAPRSSQASGFLFHPYMIHMNKLRFLGRLTRLGPSSPISLHQLSSDKLTLVALFIATGQRASYPTVEVVIPWNFFEPGAPDNPTKDRHNQIAPDVLHFDTPGTGIFYYDGLPLWLEACEEL